MRPVAEGVRVLHGPVEGLPQVVPVGEPAESYDHGGPEGHRDQQDGQHPEVVGRTVVPLVGEDGGQNEREASQGGCDGRVPVGRELDHEDHAHDDDDADHHVTDGRHAPVEAADPVGEGVVVELGLDTDAVGDPVEGGRDQQVDDEAQSVRQVLVHESISFPAGMSVGRMPPVGVAPLHCPRSGAASQPTVIGWRAAPE